MDDNQWYNGKRIVLGRDCCSYFAQVAEHPPPPRAIHQIEMVDQQVWRDWEFHH
ncbi:hypothetical protein DL93DRAFT_2086976 [Clavulina sp. PMI_390]|nr:hypothetical protein DL93DRAFT_2086976 [Clavulina sp. PMI_390]